MSITLYHVTGSCSLAVKTALNIIGEPFETIQLALSKKENLTSEYLALNPSGKVPTLVIDDNTFTEGAAILMHLNANYPNLHLLPSLGSIPYAKALRWLFFLYGPVHYTWTRVFSPERYGSDVTSIKSMAEIELNKLYAQIDDQLHKTAYIAGERTSLADLYLLVTLHWTGALTEPVLDQYTSLQAYKERMFDNKSIAKTYQIEFS